MKNYGGLYIHPPIVRQGYHQAKSLDSLREWHGNISIKDCDQLSAHLRLFFCVIITQFNITRITYYSQSNLNLLEDTLIFILEMHSKREWHDKHFSRIRFHIFQIGVLQLFPHRWLKWCINIHNYWVG